MTRSLRRIAALFSLLGLLSAQAALAAYICPIDTGRPPPSAGVHAQCGAPGETAPALDGALCELHCQVTSSVPPAPAVDLAAPAIAPLVVAEPFASRPSRDASAPAMQPEALAAAPPAAIRYCRLLI